MKTVSFYFLRLRCAHRIWFFVVFPHLCSFCSIVCLYIYSCMPYTYWSTFLHKLITFSLINQIVLNDSNAAQIPASYSNSVLSCSDSPITWKTLLCTCLFIIDWKFATKLQKIDEWSWIEIKPTSTSTDTYTKALVCHYYDIRTNSTQTELGWTGDGDGVGGAGARNERMPLTQFLV